MASTRNNNTYGNYNAQITENKTAEQYNTNKDKMFAESTYLAGNGLIQGHMPDTTLSQNSTNVESFLFGIGANNFIHPQHSFQAELNVLQSVSIVDRQVPLIMPKPLEPLPDQRPFPVPN